MTDEAQPAPETTPEPKPEPVAEAVPAAEAAPTPAAQAPAEIRPEPPAPVPVPVSPSPVRGGGEGDARERGPGGEGPAKRPLVKRHHGIVRITHWLNAVLLLGMIASGLQIYGAFPHFGPRNGPYLPNPWDGKKFPESVRLGGWLAGGLNWHFALAWPFVVGGLAYLLYLITSGEWRSLLFRPRDIPRAIQMQLYYLRLRREHPPQGKHNALQKGAYSFIIFLAIVSVLTGFAIYKPAQLSWLTALFGGYELTRYWHFWSVWIFIAFSIVHVLLVFLVDPASLRAMITGWYRGRFPSHD
jgi:thiosulfate reductase cytochrome b subunit